jgi:hypothetical protein
MTTLADGQYTVDLETLKQKFDELVLDERKIVFNYIVTLANLRAAMRRRESRKNEADRAEEECAKLEEAHGLAERAMHKLLEKPV